MAHSISSLGLVAISSSSGVICIVFAGGTAFKMVPRDLGALFTGKLFRLIHFFCLGVCMATWSTKVDLGSGVSVPLLLKIETLLLERDRGLREIW